MSVPTDIHFFEFLISDATSLPLIIIIESLRINQYFNDHITNSALNQIFQLDAMWQRWFCHIEKLIFKIIYFVIILNSLRQFIYDSSEKHVNYKCINCTFMENVENAPKILQTLRTFFVFHRQNKIKEIFIIHFTFISLVFFENSVYKYVG